MRSKLTKSLFKWWRVPRIDAEASDCGVRNLSSADFDYLRKHIHALNARLGSGDYS